MRMYVSLFSLRVYNVEAILAPLCIVYWPFGPISAGRRRKGVTFCYIQKADLLCATSRTRMPLQMDIYMYMFPGNVFYYREYPSRDRSFSILRLSAGAEWDRSRPEIQQRKREYIEMDRIYVNPVAGAISRILKTRLSRRSSWLVRSLKPLMRLFHMFNKSLYCSARLTI